MVLFFIGLGLFGEKDITLRGLEAVKQCGFVYLENYTSLFGASVELLEKLCGKKIILADRDLVEARADETILRNARKSDVAFLVVGDPLIATTHIDLLLRAKKSGIEVKIIHNSSVLNAVGETGLQLYKFGPVASIPFANEKFAPETPYAVLKENLTRALHTLLLLDLRPGENKVMRVNDGLNILLGIEKKRNENVLTEETKVVGCARLGGGDAVIKFGTVKDIIKTDFGKPLHCIIVPGRLHFVEEEMLSQFKI